MSSSGGEREDNVALVMRHTDYDEDVARRKLEVHGYDCDKVVREYLSGTAIVAQVTPSKASTNQRVFAEIRGYMDGNTTGINGVPKN